MQYFNRLLKHNILHYKYADTCAYNTLVEFNLNINVSFKFQYASS